MQMTKPPLAQSRKKLSDDPWTFWAALVSRLGEWRQHQCELAASWFAKQGLRLYHDTGLFKGSEAERTSWIWTLLSVANMTKDTTKQLQSAARIQKHHWQNRQERAL